MNNEYNNYEFILKEIENRNSKIKETKLIYRASRYGDNGNGFQNVLIASESGTLPEKMSGIYLIK